MPESGCSFDLAAGQRVSSPFKRIRRGMGHRREGGNTSQESRPLGPPDRRSATVPSIAQTDVPAASFLFSKPNQNSNPYLPENRTERQCKTRLNDRRIYLSNPDSRYRTDFFEIEKIGAGAFSEVFKVRHTMDGNLYAIKRVSRHGQQRMSQLSSKRPHEASLQEVYALAALSHHPNLVSYLDAWMEDGELYIQLEYCACSLDQRICTGNRVSSSSHSWCRA